MMSSQSAAVKEEMAVYPITEPTPTLEITQSIAAPTNVPPPPDAAPPANFAQKFARLRKSIRKRSVSIF